MQRLDDYIRELDERIVDWFTNGQGCFVIVMVIISILVCSALLVGR